MDFGETWWEGKNRAVQVLSTILVIYVHDISINDFGQGHRQYVHYHLQTKIKPEWFLCLVKLY